VSTLEEVLRQLARESGATLAELGVRPGDERWIAEHAETIASLAGGKHKRRGKGSFLYRLARRAARTAR
jgi:hypothetical protein